MQFNLNSIVAYTLTQKNKKETKNSRPNKYVTTDWDPLHLSADKWVSNVRLLVWSQSQKIQI